MEAFINDLKESAKENEAFRRVLFTTEKLQVVVMALEPGQDIGLEVHDVDQFIYLVDGEGEVELDGEVGDFEKGVAVVVPAGVQHNVVNTGHEPMDLITLYAPPLHSPGTVEKRKPAPETAMAAATE